MWNENNKIIVKYFKSEDINESTLRNVIMILTRILISGGLVLFATIVGNLNKSGFWCHWCNLLSKKWSEEYYTKGMSWTIDITLKI